MEVNFIWFWFSTPKILIYKNKKPRTIVNFWLLAYSMDHTEQSSKLKENKCIMIIKFKSQ